MSSTIKQAILSLKSRIADAYTAVVAKGGTLPATQDSANLPSAIASIPTGAAAEPEEKDVLFIDYDGTIIASYTYAELENVTEMPTPPTHDGLTFVKWTNTLAELKTYKRQITISGAMYATTDGNMHIFIEAFGASQTFKFLTWASDVMKVIWGDGNEDTYQEGQSVNVSHTYTNIGHYEIIIKHATGGELVLLNFKITDIPSKQMVEEIWCSSTNQSIYSFFGQDGLYCIPNLKKIVAPTEQPMIGGNDVLGGCMNLAAVVSDTIGGVHRAISGTGIKYLTRWYDTGQSAQNWGNNNRTLRRINFPVSPTATTGYSNNFQNNSCLQYIWINPNADMMTMSGCYSVREIHIPNTTVPTLGNTNYFTNVPTTCKIYVKTGLLSQYEAATNWSTIYSQYQFIEED